MSYFYCSTKDDKLYINCFGAGESYLIHEGGNYSDENIQKLYSLFEYKCVNFMYKYFLAFAPITKENFLISIFGKTQLKFW